MCTHTHTHILEKKTNKKENLQVELPYLHPGKGKVLGDGAVSHSTGSLEYVRKFLYLLYAFKFKFCIHLLNIYQISVPTLSLGAIIKIKMLPGPHSCEGA